LDKKIDAHKKEVDCKNKALEGAPSLVPFSAETWNGTHWVTPPCKQKRKRKFVLRDGKTDGKTQNKDKKKVNAGFLNYQVSALGKFLFLGTNPGERGCGCQCLAPLWNASKPQKGRQRNHDQGGKNRNSAGGQAKGIGWGAVSN